MQTAFSFEKTPIVNKKPIPALAQLEHLWSKAQDLYDEGKYQESIISLINYFDPSASVNNTGSEKTFDFPHGSVSIHIAINDEKLSITCPFLALPAEGEIALMRKVTEINSNVLGLSSIVLTGANLEFRFETALELCNPHKLYDVLWDICVNADYYDDEFVNEFKAIRLKEPVVTPYESVLVKQLYAYLKQTLLECNEYMSYFESKRLAYYSWDALVISLRKIDYFLQPKGYVGNMIKDAIGDLDNGDIPITNRIADAKKVIAQLEAISEETLSEDLYYSEEFVSWKRYGKLEYIQQYFENSYDVATSEIKNGSYMACVCTIQLMFMKMFYYYRLTPEIQRFAEHTMLQSSGKSWQEAAEVLYGSLDRFMEGDLLTKMSKQGFDVNSYMEQATDLSNSIMAKLTSFFK